MNFEQQRAKAELQRARASDEGLDAYFDYAKKYFILLRKHFGELDEFFDADDTRDVVLKHRGSHGGNALFRPIGLDIFVQTIAKLNGDRSPHSSCPACLKIASELIRASVCRVDVEYKYPRQL